MDCKYVHLTGGEPTVRQDLIDIVRIIRDHGMRVGLSTNGSRPTQRYLDLVDAGVELFSISLDTHERARNAQFAGVGGVFDQVVENIRVLSTKCYVSTGVVFNDNNIGQYREILEFISSLGVRDIRVGTDTRYNQVVRFDLPEALLARHPILRFRVNNFNAGLNMRGSALATTSRCHLVRDDLTIFGHDYYPCAVYARERGKPIGQFGPNNVQERADWFAQHDSHADPICQKFCMDFKCRFNDRVESYRGRA
jgi:MoaA/NifB/PqqE/SkfB family radical SAM enzyme